MGHNIRYYYKQICRHIHRIPLDNKTIGYLKTYSKSKFATPLKKGQFQHSPIDKRLYDRSMKVLNDILVNEDYKSIDTLLDFVYKDMQPQSPWISQFMKYKYTAFRPYWPQVHLLDELAHGSKHSKLYKEYLENEKDTDLCLQEYFGISSVSTKLKLKPLRWQGDNEPSQITDILLEFKKLHTFLFKNQDKLTHLKIQPIEVAYPTNRFALPLHVTQRDRLLKEKINYAKSLCEEFKPIRKESLDHLIRFAIHKPGDDKPEEAYQINEMFFRYMRRKHSIESTTLSPLTRKYLRSKKLIPNDNNIRKYIREYVRRQFYCDSSDYKMSWMQNFYENEKRIVPEIELPS